MSPQERIKEYLDNRFKEDLILKSKFEEKKLTINDCYDALEKYAKEKANNQQSICLTDDEAFNAIVHFILDGETPKIHKKDSKMQVELTETDKEAARQKAIEELKEEEIKKIKEKEKKAREREKKKRELTGQLSLFDL